MSAALERPFMSLRAEAEVSKEKGGSSQTLRAGKAWRRGGGRDRAEPMPSMPAASEEDRQGLMLV